MKFIYLLLLLAIFFKCNTKSDSASNTICVRNVNLVDPENGLIKNQNLYIKDHLIYKLKNSSQDVVPKNIFIIEGEGLYVMPGLWDAHVHFAYIEELAPAMFDLFLLNGITSVRDTGGKIGFVKKWQNRSKQNPEHTPRVMIAGPLLDGEPNVYDGSDDQHPELSVGLEDQAAVIDQVNLLDSIGVDLLKAYEMLTPEQFSTIIRIANEKDLKVTGHIPLTMDVISASNEGLHSMEHMRNLEISCASNWEELLSNRRKLLAQGKDKNGAILRTNIHNTQRPEAISNYSEDVADQVLQTLKKNDTWQIPTLTLNTLFSRRYFDQYAWTEYYKYLPDSIEQEWNKNSIELAKMEVSDFRKTYDEWNKSMFNKIYEKDISIMAGTDTPIAYLTPGLSLHEELLAFADAGMNNEDVLKTATINPAIYFGLEHKLGRIKVDYIADLILLTENPLENISNTRKTEKVFKNGKEIDLDALRTKLEGMK
ncbi:amidohydrolase family protein [Portibacter marinus]|uniref:amidohydrolase family protein n=1 Tax=Portibacter marinus TaxID=2898660 RepID=UPI001F47AF61|nr:amidohydrolase family protein [Portibacter marinus]